MLDLRPALPPEAGGARPERRTEKSPTGLSGDSFLMDFLHNLIQVI
jgi:hypothetical protein